MHYYTRCGGSENFGTVGPFKDMHDYDPSLLMMIMLKGESNANKPTLEISSKKICAAYISESLVNLSLCIF